MESWFWPHVPFSGLGDPIPSHAPVTGNSNSHSPAYTIMQPSQAGMRLGLYSPLRAASLGAHVAQASTKPGLCGRCCCQLCTPTATHLLPFSQLIKTQFYQLRSPVCSLCAARTSVLCWESLAGQGLAGCSWICWCKQSCLHVSFLTLKRPHKTIPSSLHQHFAPSPRGQGKWTWF